MTTSILHNLTSTEIFQRVGEICAAVTEVVSEEDLLNTSLEKIMELFGANRGSIFILNEDSHALVLKSVRGIKRQEVQKLVKQIGEGIVGQVAKIKQPIFVDDINTDERFQNLGKSNQDRKSTRLNSSH